MWLKLTSSWTFNSSSLLTGCTADREKIKCNIKCFILSETWKYSVHHCGKWRNLCSKQWHSFFCTFPTCFLRLLLINKWVWIVLILQLDSVCMGYKVSKCLFQLVKPPRVRSSILVWSVIKWAHCLISFFLSLYSLDYTQSQILILSSQQNPSIPAPRLPLRALGFYFSNGQMDAPRELPATFSSC